MPTDILVSELVGPDAYLHFDLPTPDIGIEDALIRSPGDAGRYASRFTARVGSETVPVDVARVQFEIDVARIHFFDPTTTKTIG